MLAFLHVQGFPSRPVDPDFMAILLEAPHLPGVEKRLDLGLFAVGEIQFWIVLPYRRPDGLRFRIRSLRSGLGREGGVADDKCRQSRDLDAKVSTRRRGGFLVSMVNPFRPQPAILRRSRFDPMSMRLMQMRIMTRMKPTCGQSMMRIRSIICMPIPPAPSTPRIEADLDVGLEKIKDVAQKDRRELGQIPETEHRQRPRARAQHAVDLPSVRGFDGFGNSLPRTAESTTAIAQIPAKGPRPTTWTKTRAQTRLSMPRTTSKTRRTRARSHAIRFTFAAATKARGIATQAPMHVPQSAMESVSPMATRNSRKGPAGAGRKEEGDQMKEAARPREQAIDSHIQTQAYQNEHGHRRGETTRHPDGPAFLSAPRVLLWPDFRYCSRPILSADQAGSQGSQPRSKAMTTATIMSTIALDVLVLKRAYRGHQMHADPSGTDEADDRRGSDVDFKTQERIAREIGKDLRHEAVTDPLGPGAPGRLYAFQL